jgi:hypothetical protein
MQGILETPGLTVAGHLGHGRVKVAPTGPPPHVPRPQKRESTRKKVGVSGPNPLKLL